MIPPPPKPNSIPSLPSPPTQDINLVAKEDPLLFRDTKHLLPEEVVIKEPMTHKELLDQIISTTLKPEHYADPNILRFIANYNVCKDVKQAAKEAGLHVKDGHNLINRPDIYDCIQKIAAAGSRKFGYDADEIVEKVKEVVNFDPVDLFDPETGAFYEDLTKVPPEIRRVIKKLNVINVYEKDDNGIVIGVSGKILKFEFWDKLKAAEMLGSEKDVFKKQVKVEHDVGVNMKQTLLGRLEAAEERKALAAKDVGHG